MVSRTVGDADPPLIGGHIPDLFFVNIGIGCAVVLAIPIGRAAEGLIVANQLRGALWIAMDLIKPFRCVDVHLNMGRVGYLVFEGCPVSNPTPAADITLVLRIFAARIGAILIVSPAVRAHPGSSHHSVTTRSIGGKGILLRKHVRFDSRIGNHLDQGRVTKPLPD